MQREQWASRHGFILAILGGAAGIGNIWRFSHIAGENGGAVFLFLYLAFVLLIGIRLVIAELSVGRHAQGGAIAAFQVGHKQAPWGVIGWLGVIITVLAGYALSLPGSRAGVAFLFAPDCDSITIACRIHVR